MTYTEKSLQEALVRLCSSSVQILIDGGIHMPTICMAVANRCFVDKIENEDTELLRQAMRDLESGHFNYAKDS